MSPFLRSLAVGAAFAGPTLFLACGLSPNAVPSGGHSSGTSTGSGGATTSSATGGGGSTTSSTSSSSGTTSSSSTSGSGGTGGAGGAPPDAGEAEAPIVCNTTVTEYPPVASPHIPVCSPVSYGSNPPTSGPHYPIWAAFKTYATPVPEGFYVHDLEHGAVVITYNCPAGCDAELGQLAAWLDARPVDPLCVAPITNRVVVTPDPLIPTRFAASAWGWALTSECLDLDALGAFMDAHYAMAPESFCSDGVDVTSPDAGLPAGCLPGDAGAD